MINAESIALMKNSVRILNFSRAELVNDADLLEALCAGKVSAYVSDFPTDEVLDAPGVIAIPHLGASTPESEDNCAYMASKQIIDFLETGNIKNSVNLPNVELGAMPDSRICVIHKNIPNMLTQISGLVSHANINIETMINKSKKDYAYTVLDIVGSAVPDSVVDAIRGIDGIVRAWKI